MPAAKPLRAVTRQTSTSFCACSRYMLAIDCNREHKISHADWEASQLGMHAFT
jgi:hypothetical protein